MTKKIIFVLAMVGILVTIGALAIYQTRDAGNYRTETQTDGFKLYTDTVSGISFSYSEAWGEVNEEPGNKTCPEEDTYRTPETLSIFDRELGFKDIDLPESESFIRTGIRFRNFDPSVEPTCNEDALRRLARGEITGEEFSSFRLERVGSENISGVKNENASRLDTEGRVQYTYFKKLDDNRVLIIQPYFSFIPYFDSPEWKEINANYKGDIARYIKEGTTAQNIRNNLEQFRKLAGSIK